MHSSGIPHKPKPPAAIVAPSRIPRSASAAFARTLFIFPHSAVLLDPELHFSQPAGTQQDSICAFRAARKTMPQSARAIQLPDPAQRSQLRRAVIASTIGTAIEWYDFFLYSTVTGLLFGKLFFPNSDPWVGTLEAFAIYAVGFVARPVVAAIFAHYVDRIGRKATLIPTLLLIALATCA